MPATDTPAGYLNPPQVATLLACTPGIVRAWARKGCRVNGQTVSLQCEFVGARYLIRPEWVEEFKAECERARKGEIVPVVSPKKHDLEAAERRRQAALAELRNW